MGKKMEKFKTGTEKTVKTAGKVATVATLIIKTGELILDTMNKNKNKK